MFFDNELLAVCMLYVLYVLNMYYLIKQHCILHIIRHSLIQPILNYSNVVWQVNCRHIDKITYFTLLTTLQHHYSNNISTHRYETTLVILIPS